jgi:hypothetical protein
VLSVAGLRLDPATHQVWRGTEEIVLTAREVAILEAFMRRPGKVLSRLTCWRWCGTATSTIARGRNHLGAQFWAVGPTLISNTLKWRNNEPSTRGRYDLSLCA